MESISIRPLSNQDRGDICQIAFDTAFLGQSGSSMIEDKNLFFDIGVYYFFRFEKKHSFVALLDNQVVGYLLSTQNIMRYFWITTLFIVPFIVLPKLLFFRYRLGKKTIRFFFLLTVESFLRRIPRAPTWHYSTELHINLAEEARGKGIASQLMQELMVALAKTSIHGIQLNTTSENLAALKLYHRFGFRELVRKPSYRWSVLKGFLVHNITMVKDMER